MLRVELCFNKISGIMKPICLWFVVGVFWGKYQNSHVKTTLQQEQRLKELSKKPSTSSTTAASPVSTASGSISTTPAIDLFSTPSSNNR